MSPAWSRLLATAVAATLAAPSAAPSQILPSDLRPFVRLDYEFTIRRYLNPIIRDDKVLDYGVLVEGPTKRTHRNGSGTVVTRDGLILTNFHVYQDLLEDEALTLSEDRRTLLRQTMTSREMLVAEVDAKNPLDPPKVQYRAKLVAVYPERDVAVLKISSLASGAPLPTAHFATAPLGNPYAIPLGGELRILGYPGKGGESVTPSRTEFAGYTTDVPYAIDGSFKTVSTIAGGNSGGSALYGQRLVGIPTRVSRKDDKGSDFGYIHPVSWAALPLALTALRDGQEIPRIDRDWVESPHNTDVTRTRILVGGRVQSQMSTRPVKKARVVLHRTDRTTEQIQALQSELGAFAKRARARSLLDQGAPPELIVLVLGLPLQTVQELAKGGGAEPALSADAKKVAAGEFYFASAEVGDDGFFMVAVPRKTAIKLSVQADGFRPATPDRKTGDAVYEDLGTIALAPEMMRPEPVRR